MPASSIHLPFVHGLPRCRSPGVDPQCPATTTCPHCQPRALGSPETRYVQDGAGVSVLSPVWTQPPGEHLQPQQGQQHPAALGPSAHTNSSRRCRQLQGSCPASAISTMTIPLISFPRFTLKNSFFLSLFLFFFPLCKLLWIPHF